MELVTKINWVDVLVIIIMARLSYVAFQDGLSHEIFPLLGSIFTVIFSIQYYHKIAYSIYQYIAKVPIVILDFITFSVLVIATGFIFKFIKVLLDKIIKVTWHPLIEKFGGVITGIIRASIVTSTVLIILALIPLPYLQWSIRDRSLTGMYFFNIGPEIYIKASSFLPVTKIEEEPLTRDSLVRTLLSEKTLEVKKDAKKRKKRSSWEDEIK
jgi:uncharacterized membrane protein required for colicin V production